MLAVADRIITQWTHSRYSLSRAARPTIRRPSGGSRRPLQAQNAHVVRAFRQRIFRFRLQLRAIDEAIRRTADPGPFRRGTATPGCCCHGETPGVDWHSSTPEAQHRRADQRCRHASATPERQRHAATATSFRSRGVVRTQPLLLVLDTRARQAPPPSSGHQNTRPRWVAPPPGVAPTAASDTESMDGYPAHTYPLGHPS